MAEFTLLCPKPKWYDIDL